MCIAIFLESLTGEILKGSRNCLCVFPKRHLLSSFNDDFKRLVNDGLIIFCYNLYGLGDEKTTVEPSVCWVISGVLGIIDLKGAGEISEE